MEAWSAAEDDVNIRFDVGGENTISIKELSEFWSLFYTTYSIALEYYRTTSVYVKYLERLIESQALCVEGEDPIWSQLESLEGLDINALSGEILKIYHSRRDRTLESYFYSDPESSQLMLSRISMESPISVWAQGVVTALVCAVILSGGSVDLLKGKYEVGPIGDGITKLRDALMMPETEKEESAALEPKAENQPSVKTPTLNIQGRQSDTKLKSKDV
jgi:hypothetical protein